MVLVIFTKSVQSFPDFIKCFDIGCTIGKHQRYFVQRCLSVLLTGFLALCISQLCLLVFQLYLYLSFASVLLISLLKCLKVRWTLLCSLLDSAVAGALSSHPKSFAALANNCASSLVIPPTTTILTGAFNYYTYRYDTNSSMLMTINQSSKCVYHNICDISNMFSYSNKHIIYSVSIYDSIYM